MGLFAELEIGQGAAVGFPGIGGVSYSYGVKITASWDNGIVKEPYASAQLTVWWVSISASFTPSSVSALGGVGGILAPNLPGVPLPGVTAAASLALDLFTKGTSLQISISVVEPMQNLGPGAVLGMTIGVDGVNGDPAPAANTPYFWGSMNPTDVWRPKITYVNRQFAYTAPAIVQKNLDDLPDYAGFDTPKERMRAEDWAGQNGGTGPRYSGNLNWGADSPSEHVSPQYRPGGGGTGQSQVILPHIAPIPTPAPRSDVTPLQVVLPNIAPIPTPAPRPGAPTPTFIPMPTFTTSGGYTLPNTVSVIPTMSPGWGMSPIGPVPTYTPQGGYIFPNTISVIPTPAPRGPYYPNPNHGMGGGGIGSQPVLLDLSGDGISVDTLQTSRQFVDLDGDAYQHRTAWAGTGTGVLVLDADGDGKISRSSEFVFTEWDRTATGDLEALKSVFDTNHNGLLDAGDDRWSEFKVMVDGQLVSLASLGIASIGLTATGSGQKFADGSAITGTAQFTRTDGSTGTVGDAVLVSDAYGYIIKSTTVTNVDGSKTTNLGGYNKDGTLAFQNRITVSADRLSTTTQFDDDGNGTYERSQTDVTTVTVGVRQRVVSDFKADGSLAGRTTTTTSADKTTVTTAVDQDGDGSTDQTQVFVKNGDGSTTTAVSEFSFNGTLLRKTVTTAAADGLSKTVQSDSTGNGVFDHVSTETTVIGGDGTRTKTVAETSSGDTLIGKEQTVTSADGRVRTVSYDLDGNGVYETRDVTAISNGADGLMVTTVSTYSSTNVLTGKIVATTSGDGLAKTISKDFDGDGLFDTVSSDTTVVGTGGSLTKTEQTKSRNGSLLFASTTQISADRKTISTTTDSDGDGYVDLVKTIVVDGAGVTTATSQLLNPNGSNGAKTWDVTSVDGLSVTSKTDLDGDGIADVVVTDITTTDASSNRTRTVTTKSANGALIGSTATTTSADSLTQTVKGDINADGTVDRTTVAATVLGGDGSRTVTTTTTSASGAVLGKTEVKTSADRKTTTTKVDLNGDNKIDRTQVDVVNADGSRVTTVSDTDANGTLHFKDETTVSADRLVVTDKKDVNGDGIYDVITQAVTAIASTGVRTTTTSKTSGNGALLARAISAVSANGLVIDGQIDADGDGIFENKSNNVTVLNADGSTTRTASSLAGSGALIGRTITATSANGLTSTVQTDLDGNGTVDQTTTATTILGADGSKTDTVTVKSGNGVQTSRTQTITNGNGNSVITTIDHDGNGTTDESVTKTLNANGSSTEVTSTYSSNGTLTSTATYTVSANGLSRTLSTDLDGNGTIDQSTTSVTVLNADGSKTETITDFDAAGAVKDKTVVVTSANGLSKTVTWAAVGATTSRSMADVTVLSADGSTVKTIDYKKENGALESRTVTTTSADKLTTTTTKDVDGNGVIDQKIVSVIGNDGKVTRTLTDYGVNGVAIVGKKTFVIGADGLSETVDYDTDGNGVVDTRTVSATVLNADGSTTETVGTYAAGPSGLVLKGQATTTTSGNGQTTTRTWDVDGNGSVDRTETDVAVLNADGSRKRTLSTFVGATLSQKIETTTSANGLSATVVRSGTDGTGTYSQTTTDTTIIDAGGVKTRTILSSRGDGSVLSKIIETTSADGRSVNIREEREGLDTRIITHLYDVLADGTTVDTTDTKSVAGVLLSKSIVTTTADGRKIKTSRDIDGNGTIDQIEDKELLTGGGSRTTIRSFGFGNVLEGSTTILVSADGLTTVTEWDNTSNGSVDRKRTAVTATRADGQQTTTITDVDSSGVLQSKSTTIISADGRTQTVSRDLDGDGSIDRTETRITDLSGVSVTTLVNTVEGRKEKYLSASEVRWTQTNAAKSETTVAADGLSYTERLDYDGDGVFEYVAHTQVRIDGSLTTTIVEKNANGSVKATGSITRSADGLTTILQKDVGGNGGNDQIQRLVTNVDGSVTRTTIDYETTGTLKQTVVETIRATGEFSKSVKTDALGRKVSEAVFDFNDGATVHTFFAEDTGAVKSRQRIDKNGNISSNVLYDPTNAQPWARVEQTFSAGVVTFERQFMDDGTRSDITFDTTNTQPWSRTQDNYDVAGRRTFHWELLDNGTGSSTSYDVVNGQTWATIKRSHDSSGKLTSEVVNYDIGAKSVIGFDTSNTENWYQYHDKYDVTGSRIYSKIFRDTGFVDEFYWDTKSNEPWSRVYYSYDGTGRRYSEGVTWDDGTSVTSVLSGTVLDRYYYYASGSLRRWERYYNVNGNVPSALGSVSMNFEQIRSGLVEEIDLRPFDASNPVTGNSYNNTLIGTSGNDTLNGGAGADRMEGKAGNDIYYVDHLGDRVIEVAGQGIDTVFSTVTFGLAGQDIENLTLQGTASIDGTGNDLANVIVGNSGNNILDGGKGADELRGGDGNDTLIGGAGNDQLYGGTGNDRYLFNAGDGSDTIVESGASTDNDELEFGVGIDWNELWFRQQGNNLVISVLGTTDSVTVKDWFAGPGNVVETIKAGDGNLLRHTDVAGLVAAMASFSPATSGTGTGVQPNDPRLGDASQMGTIAATMRSSWSVAA